MDDRTIDQVVNMVLGLPAGGARQSEPAPQCEPDVVVVDRQARCEMSTTGRELDAVEGAEGRLRLALSSLRAAKQLAEDAEDQLYGYRCRDGRAQRRIDDAIEATMARLKDVGPGEPDQADEPVDLDSPPR